MKCVVLSYFKISNVSIETGEVMKSRMDGRHAVMGGLLASELLWYPVAINFEVVGLDALDHAFDVSRVTFRVTVKRKRYARYEIRQSSWRET